MAEVQTLRWLLLRIRRRIPLLILLLLFNAGSSVLSVFFALGNKEVINGATSGNWDVFLRACGLQLLLVVGVVLCTTVSKYLAPKLTDELDRDWKKDMLHGMLHGEYTAVSKYHSGELLNRLNNDVRVLNEGLITALPNLVAMATRLIAAVITLFAMEPWFTVALAALGVVAVFATGVLRKGLQESQ